MAIRVLSPGATTTVQDRGRSGYQDLGFSPAGVMDWRAAALVNVLVGNDRAAAVLEYAISGPTLRFDMPATVALGGADVAATLDGRPVPTNQALTVPSGSTLEVGPVRRGQFGYLAISGGGIGTAPAMGSRSTSVRYELGGLEGRTLHESDELPLVDERAAAAPLGAMGARAVFAEDAFYGWDGATSWVRVVPAADERAFTAASLEAFWDEPFEVTGRSDRMGYRLGGPRLELTNDAGIISEGIALGTIQVPPHGQPIVVLADHQTTGGYAKIGTVASCDVPRLVQCAPGRPLRFERVTVTKAQELLRDDVAYLRTLRATIEREAAREAQRGCPDDHAGHSSQAPTTGLGEEPTR